MTGALTILTSIGREMVHTLLPSWCVACEGDLPWKDRTASCCAPCWAALPRITGAKCVSCARPLPGRVSERSDRQWGDGFQSCAPSDEIQTRCDGLQVSAPFCLPCQLEPLPLEWCDAWGHYSGTLEPVIRAFKFARHDFLAAPLAGLLAEVVDAKGQAFDAIVPVPMSRGKERSRGYNQAGLLARALSRRIGVTARNDLLTRPREGETQSQLNREQRAANVRGAFAASPEAAGLRLLVVDDISTTGETLRACARALHSAGASAVCAVVVAKVS